MQIMKITLMKSYKNYKKICFFLPSLKTGGAEKVLINIANNISKDSSFDVTFVAANVSGIYKNFFNHKVKLINLKSSRLRYTFFKLVNILKAENFDIVFTTMPHANVFLCLIKKIFNFNFKLFIRQSNIYNITSINLKSGFFILLMKFSYRYADYIISNCKEVYYETKNFFKIESKKNFLIYNPTNLQKIKLLSKKKIKFNFLKTKSTKIISVGKLSAQKNFISLIECANYMINILKKDFKFLIIGEGEQYNDLNKKIYMYKLQKNVRIIKFVENPYKYMSKCDLLVQTSLWEGSSNILIEALMCNTRVVCYDIPGGTKEILANRKNGFLAKVNDYENLSKKILQSLQQKKDIKNKNLLLFDMKSNITKYKNLFNKSSNKKI